MSAAPSLRVDKQFTYRGGLVTFSNRYHFHGGTPADSTHWTTFSDAVVTAEKAIYFTLANGGAKIIGTVGYAGGSEVPVFSKTYTTDGTLGISGVGWTPGDVAALIRYSTSARTSKNHPIYCFNYYHSVGIDGSSPSGKDSLIGTQKTAMQTYAAAWIAGFSDGTNTLVRCSPRDAVCSGYFVEPLVTHRDLSR